jgi:hypothetical protein
MARWRRGRFGAITMSYGPRYKNFFRLHSLQPLLVRRLLPHAMAPQNHQRIRRLALQRICGQ